jgi:hypothetical protein
MVLWKHRLDYRTKPISYSHFGWHQLLEHNREPSTRERIDNLTWAREHCGGLFRVIIAVPIDQNDVARGIAEVYPQDRLVMRVVELNESTGEFRAEAVEEDVPSSLARKINPSRRSGTKPGRHGRSKTDKSYEKVDADWSARVAGSHKPKKRSRPKKLSRLEITENLRALPDGKARQAFLLGARVR